MQQRFYFEYASNGNLSRTEFTDDKLYQWQQAAAEYFVKMADPTDVNNWLPSDSVFINFIRPDSKSASVRMTYDSEFGGWKVTTNGWETDVDISTSSDLTVSFVARRYSTVDATLLVKSMTSESVVLTIYPTAGYTPLNIAASDLDIINAELSDHEGRINDLESEMGTAQQDILDLNADKVDKTTTIAGVDLQNNITASELKTALAVNNVDNTSDANKPISTAQQAALDLKANIANPTFTGTVTIPTPTTGDNSTKAASTAFVKTAVDNAIITVYKPKGSVADYDALLALTGMQNGDVYSVTAAHDTTPIFNAGTNFAWISDTSLWDNLGGIVDLSGLVAKVTTGDKKQVYGVNSTNEQTTYDIGGMYGVAELDGFGKVPLEQMNVKPWITVTVSSNAFTYNCTGVSGYRNYKLTNSQNIVLTIANAPIGQTGYSFEIEVHGGVALTLPTGCKTDVSFDYTTVIDNTQYYVYSFVLVTTIGGNIWRVMRNVFDE